ncbi:Adenylate cyclase 2 [compost metagenome]
MSGGISSTQMREFEVLEEIKSVLNVVANWMAIPLVMVFWFADLMYVPDQKWTFLLLRLTIIPVCICVKRAIEKTHDLIASQAIACLYAFMVALPINIMIALIGSPGTRYYAGLNLVAMGGLSFIPFSTGFFVWTALGIYLPYFAITIFHCHSLKDYTGMAVNSFFIFGTIVICFLIRYFNENLRIREINSRLALKSEIANRDHTIKTRTEEAVRLKSLSTQFSPQVVRAIREGRVDLEKGVHRAQICAIFVDVVGSTERMVRLDQNKVDMVLARFMDTVVSTFLKYELTIDKFQGDGILAFSNDPVKHGDFIQRTCLAALEVRELLREDRQFYLTNWKKEMQIRIGIAAGFANVGFYGNKKFFRSYTAIGEPLPFATNLTGLAEPNQIVVDSDIAITLIAEGFGVFRMGEYAIKGFEGDNHVVYSLDSAPMEKATLETQPQHCPRCIKPILFLDTNDKGIFVMKCHECDFELSSPVLTTT